MLARVLQTFSQGELPVFLKNVGCKYEFTIANDNQVSIWRKTCQFQFHELHSIRRDENVGEALDEDLSKNPAKTNGHVQKQRKLRHSKSQKDENIRKVNIKSKVQKKLEILQYQDFMSRKYFDLCIEQNNKPFWKTNGGSVSVVLKENKIVFHSDENVVLSYGFQSMLQRAICPLQDFKIHHAIRPKSLVEIVKKIADEYSFESSTNLHYKPLIIQGMLVIAIQTHSRNFCLKNGLGSKQLTNDETKNKQINIVQQHMSGKQSPSYFFQRKQVQETEQKLPQIEGLKNLKYIHAFLPSHYDINEVKSNKSLIECTNLQLKTKGNYMNNFNFIKTIADKLFQKNTAALFDIPMITPLYRRKEPCLGAIFPRADSQIAFSSFCGGSNRDKNKSKCKKTCKTKTSDKKKSKCVKKRKPKKKGKKKCPEEHLTEICIPKRRKLDNLRTENSGSCVQRSKTCESRKPKKMKPKENMSMCSQNIQELCEKIKKLSNSTRDCEPDCKIKGCTDICSNESCTAVGQSIGQKSMCREICTDAVYDPCKKKEIVMCKEAFKKVNNQGNMCYKKLKCELAKCQPTKKKKTPLPPVCCWLKKALTKKPKIIYGDCNEESETRLEICNKRTIKDIINNIIHKKKKKC